MKQRHRKSAGFTLMELVIVIGIISILTAIIVTELGKSRQKAKDSAIMRELKQFEILLGFEFTETGSYANLQPNKWFPLEAACSSAFSGNHQTEAKSICTKILQDTPLGTQVLYVGSTNPAKYSISASLNNYPGFIYCVGSSGSGKYADNTGAGCSTNP